MILREYPLIDEQVYSKKLPNGLSVFVVPKRSYNKSYAFFATNYGGADRRFSLSGNWIDTPEGVAHFLEHKMFDTEDGNALAKLSGNGASPNAYTSTNITAYFFECIEKFSENLEILLDFVSTPFFTPESVEKEQGIIAQEILMCEDDPGYCLYYGLMKSLFRHNPIRDSVAGTVESISEITSKTLYDCHKVFYNPSNMALCVVGDVEPSGIMDIAQRVLPSEQGEVPQRDYGAKESLVPESGAFTKAMEVSLPIFFAGCKSEPAAPGRDRLHLELVSDLALDILAGHSSPLFFRLYSEGLINSDFSCSFDCEAGAAYSMIGGESRCPELVFEEIKKEIAKLADGNIDSELFGRIKKAAIGSQIRTLNSFEAISSGIVTGHFEGYDTFEAPEILASITLDDVARFYGENLKPDYMAISTITPKEQEEAH